jgi:hypothetical protein
VTEPDGQSGTLPSGLTYHRHHEVEFSRTDCTNTPARQLMANTAVGHGAWGVGAMGRGLTYVLGVVRRERKLGREAVLGC